RGSGLGRLTEELVPTLEELDHVALESDAVDQRTDRAERAAVVDDVGHQRAAVTLLEAVLVPPARERSSGLLVDEAHRPLVPGDPRRHRERDAEVPRLPRHVVAEGHPAGTDTADDLLPGAGRLRVEVDVE